MPDGRPTEMVTRAGTLTEFGRVRAMQTTHAPGASMPLHEHPNAYVSFVLSGEYVERVGTSAVPCVTYRTRFHPAGEVHADTFGARGGRCLNFELDGSWDDDLTELGLTDPSDVIVVDTLAWTALEAWNAFVRPGALSALVVEEAVATMLGACVRSRREMRAADAHAGLRRAVEFLCDSACTRFTLRNVAAQARMHPTHLARVFRERVGCTIGEYTRRLRCVRALDWIREHPSWSLSRVAIEAGFCDHPHLSRVFAATFGASPARLRRTRRDVLGERA